MESTLERVYRKLQRRIGQVQEKQGSEGCYMELLNQARQTSGLIRSHAYMFEDPVKKLKQIRYQLRRLPQNQNWRLVDNRIRAIQKLTKD